MRKLLLIGFLMSFTLGLQAQNDAISKYFNQYRDDDRFTMVSINQKMFELIANLTEEDTDDEVLEMLSELKGLKILMTEESPKSFYNEAVAKINTKEYEELMTVRDKDQNIQFLVKDQQKGKIVNELLLLVGGEDEFVLISFEGKIYLNKLSKLVKNLDIDGLESLEHLDK